jgi:hypothetical protein
MAAMGEAGDIDGGCQRHGNALLDGGACGTKCWKIAADQQDIWVTKAHKFARAQFRLRSAIADQNEPTRADERVELRTYRPFRAL